MNKKYVQIGLFAVQLVRTAVVLLAVLAIGQARAACPEHTVTLIVPFPPGGPTDPFGRLPAAELSAGFSVKYEGPDELRGRIVRVVPIWKEFVERAGIGTE